jgi:hypothetical protein
MSRSSKFDQEWIEILNERLSFYTALTISLLIDAGFLIGRALLSEWYDRAVAWLDPSTLEHWMLTGFKVLFEVSTYYVVLVFVAVDAKKIIRRISKKQKVLLGEARNLINGPGLKESEKE